MILQGQHYNLIKNNGFNGHPSPMRALARVAMTAPKSYPQVGLTFDEGHDFEYFGFDGAKNPLRPITSGLDYAFDAGSFVIKADTKPLDKITDALCVKHKGENVFYIGTSTGLKEYNFTTDTMGELLTGYSDIVKEIFKFKGVFYILGVGNVYKVNGTALERSLHVTVPSPDDLTINSVGWNNDYIILGTTNNGIRYTMDGITWFRKDLTEQKWTITPPVLPATTYTFVEAGTQSVSKIRDVAMNLASGPLFHGICDNGYVGGDLTKASLMITDQATIAKKAGTTFTSIPADFPKMITTAMFYKQRHDAGYLTEADKRGSLWTKVTRASRAYTITTAGLSYDFVRRGVQAVFDNTKIVDLDEGTDLDKCVILTNEFKALTFDTTPDKYNMIRIFFENPFTEKEKILAEKVSWSRHDAQKFLYGTVPDDLFKMTTGQTSTVIMIQEPATNKWRAFGNIDLQNDTLFNMAKGSGLYVQK